MDRQAQEYVALRETIRARGTVRMVLPPAVIAAWAATAIATAAVITIAISTLVPLLVLVAGFEAVYALHLNVERAGIVAVDSQERGSRRHAHLGG